MEAINQYNPESFDWAISVGFGPRDNDPILTILGIPHRIEHKSVVTPCGLIPFEVIHYEDTPGRNITRK